MRGDGPVCRHTLEQECRVLLVHGVLHLLGHDHELGQQVHKRIYLLTRRHHLHHLMNAAPMQ